MNGIGPAAGQTFTEIDTLVLRNVGVSGGTSAPFYNSGQYIVLYDGQGTLAYDFDAVKNSSLSTVGRDVLDINTPSADGVRIRITSTDPNHTGNYVRNIRMVYAPNEALLASGEIFNPDFIKRISAFKTLRFMEWMHANSLDQTSWATRPTPDQAFWGMVGVPAEVILALCNEVHEDAWLNIPPMATDDYVTQLATLTHSLLNSSSKVYLEYANEIWSGGGTSVYFKAQGWIYFPNAANDNNATYIFGVLRSVQVGAIWKNAWGSDAGRIIHVAGGWNGNTAYNSYILDLQATAWGGLASYWTGTAGSHFDALAVAPYFGYPVPDTFTLDQLFTEIMQGGLVPAAAGGYPGGMIKQTLDWAATNYSIASTRGLPLVSYEGGQTLVDYSHADSDLDEPICSCQS